MTIFSSCLPKLNFGAGSPPNSATTSSSAPTHEEHAGTWDLGMSNPVLETSANPEPSGLMPAETSERPIEHPVPQTPLDQATQTDKWKVWLRKYALAAGTGGSIVITGGILFALERRGYFDPNYGEQAHTRMTNFIKGCLDEAGITNIDPSQLASDVIGYMKDNWTGAPVEKEYATTPNWENQVQCPENNTYYEKLPGVQTVVFVDAVNNVLLPSVAAIARPAQILLFAGLLIGALINFPLV